MPTVVILSSGGIKSAVAAARYAKDHELILLHVNHGQPAATRESAALDRLVQNWKNTRVVRATLPHMIQLRTTTPADRSGGEGQVSRGIVGSMSGVGTPTPVGTRGLLPVLCSLGLQAALGYRATLLAVGLTKNDDATHIGLAPVETRPDLRREFLHAFNTMSETLLRPRGLKLEAPLVDLQHHEVLLLAQRFQIPLEHTWSCDKPATHPCNQCDACKARTQAFAQAGFPDPLSVCIPAGA